MGGASADNQSYRRGQALGFTVAELFTLLLFLVLLILAAVEQHQKSAARAAQQKSNQVQRRTRGCQEKQHAALAEKNDQIRKYFGVPENFGDNFRDLVPSKGGLSDRQKQQALKEKAEAADEIDGLLNGSCLLYQDRRPTRIKIRSQIASWGRLNLALTRSSDSKDS